ncbi:DUF5989 family protein [Patescibacteria group bacterium]|nr:DUF5989 family protein [Patescibacteria group bacterium]
MKDLLAFLWKEKKWWLVPPLVVFVIFGVLLVLSTASPVSPFIYMLF